MTENESDGYCKILNLDCCFIIHNYPSGATKKCKKMNKGTNLSNKYNFLCTFKASTSIRLVSTVTTGVFQRPPYVHIQCDLYHLCLLKYSLLQTILRKLIYK